MNHSDNTRGFSKNPFDLSEEASKRSDEEATHLARQAESDDANEETGIGPVDEPKEGLFGSNKLPTSLDDE